MTQTKIYYYDFVDLTKNKNDEPEKIYRILVQDNDYEYRQNNDYRSFDSDILDKLFIEYLFALDITKIEDFLDYHFNTYTSNDLASGKDFILHTSYIVKKCLSQRMPAHHPVSGTILSLPPLDFKEDSVLKWLEQAGSESEDNEPDKLTHRQQILLLHSLGVFEIKEIKKMGAEQKGILFGNLLNRNEKNTENYIRYIAQKDETKYNIYSNENLNKVKGLLSDLDLLTDSIKSKLT